MKKTIQLFFALALVGLIVASCDNSNVKEIEMLHKQEVIDVASYNNGNPIFLTENGIWFYYGEPFYVEEGHLDHMYCFHVDDFGRLLIGGDKGLYIHNYKTMYPVPGSENVRVTGVTTLTKDIIFWSHSRMYYYDDHKNTTTEIKGFSADESIMAAAFDFSSYSRELWVGTSYDEWTRGRLYKINLDSVSKKAEFVEEAPYPVHSLFLLDLNMNPDVLLVGTRYGLYWYKKGERFPVVSLDQYEIDSIVEGESKFFFATNSGLYSASWGDVADSPDFSVEVVGDFGPGNIMEFAGIVRNHLYTYCSVAAKEGKYSRAYEIGIYK